MFIQHSSGTTGPIDDDDRRGGDPALSSLGGRPAPEHSCQAPPVALLLFVHEQAVAHGQALPLAEALDCERAVDEADAGVLEDEAGMLVERRLGELMLVLMLMAARCGGRRRRRCCW